MAAAEPVGVALLGSTGSLGCQVLDVIRAFPERFRVLALAAQRDATGLAEQAREFRPSVLALVEAGAREVLPADLRARTVVGPEAIAGLAADPEIELIVLTVAGQAGLPIAWSAVEAGKRLCLANKESLVMAGGLLQELAGRRGARILPIDSEHVALAQLLAPLKKEEVRRLVLTASGGPFLGKSAAALQAVRPEDALAHPTWAMGRKISIDSATLMNKGFELIAAAWLFGLPLTRLSVVLHPASLVHALVELVDGSTLAHLARPDMRLAIAWAMAWPERLPLVDRLARLQPISLPLDGPLTFLPADGLLALDLCRAAAQVGGGAEAALAAADEVAVEAFLGGRIPFPAITELVARTLDTFAPRPVSGLADVLAASADGDRLARAALARMI